MSFTLKSFAKINWQLRIIGRRPDGFHELCTVFQTVSLCDKLFFEMAAEGVELSCDDPALPVDGQNLIIRAARLLREKYGVARGVRIHLDKLIPAPGGLGGGSSNAAVTLLGLNRLWKLGLQTSELVELGSVLGSDVPFFFYGGTALGTGRGTEISPLPDVAKKHILIVTPDVKIDTARAFARLNAPDLTNEVSKSILKICREEAESLYTGQFNLVNDFEKPVFEIAPVIEGVKKKLVRSGAESSLLSGSGASVFAVFNSKDKIRKVFEEFTARGPGRKKYIAETVSRSAYADLLGISQLSQ